MRHSSTATAAYEVDSAALQGRKPCYSQQRLAYRLIPAVFVAIRSNALLYVRMHGSSELWRSREHAKSSNLLAKSVRVQRYGTRASRRDCRKRLYSVLVSFSQSECMGFRKRLSLGQGEDERVDPTKLSSLVGFFVVCFVADAATSRDHGRLYVQMYSTASFDWPTHWCFLVNARC